MTANYVPYPNKSTNTMIKARKLIFVTQMSFGLVLLACEETYRDHEDCLVDLISNQRMGDTTDYWLERKGSWSGEWDKVVLIFGFGSGDYQVCQEIAEDQNRRERRIRPNYRCGPAN